MADYTKINDKNAYTVTGIDGEKYTIDWSGAEGFKVNNGWNAGTKEQVNEAIAYFLTTGVMPKASDVKASVGQWENVEADLKSWMSANGLDEDSFSGYTGTTKQTEEQMAADAELGSMNAYYKSLYDVQGPAASGESGQALYDNLANVYMDQAKTDQTMANVAFQQQAMQQAATVKQITDQVRAERMARLKSGMSESQIANQDMQMMMANVNTLNQNTAMMNQARLEAQAGVNNAQNQAYLAYLDQSNARGQIATGQYAADVGSVEWLARQLRIADPTLSPADSITAAQGLTKYDQDITN